MISATVAATAPRPVVEGGSSGSGEGAALRLVERSEAGADDLPKIPELGRADAFIDCVERILAISDQPGVFQQKSQALGLELRNALKEAIRTVEYSDMLKMMLSKRHDYKQYFLQEPLFKQI